MPSLEAIGIRETVGRGPDYGVGVAQKGDAAHAAGRARPAIKWSSPLPTTRGRPFIG